MTYISDDQIREILQNPLERSWRAHGIGFIKTYLDAERTWRLNVYNSIFETPGISKIHDHPWALISHIRAGQLRNSRYIECREKSAGARPMLRGVINCALFNGLEGKPEPCFLFRCPTEIYHPGDWYAQRPAEVHDTEAMDGTVTVLKRGNVAAGDGTARVFWPKGEEWGDATRLPLTEEEITSACTTALLGMLKR